MTFAEKAINYFLNVNPADKFPENISFINPYSEEKIRELIKSFYSRFYNDERKRIFILGINPGRFGGGLTGISFTDPVALREACGIENDLGNQKELSSDFVYRVIKEFGGPGSFFSEFFLSALFPLALVSNGKNYNYYDNRNLAHVLRPEIMHSLKSQFEFGAEQRCVLSLGKKNSRFLFEINKEVNLFDEIIELDHPRFIMQYKRKFLRKYLDQYLNTLDRVLRGK